MTNQPINDCFQHDGRRLPHAEALALLKSRIRPITTEQSVPLHDAAGRIASRPVQASHPVPSRTNSAVDGYAFAYAYYDARLGSRLPVVGRVAAGHTIGLEASVPTGAVRIFTGAVLPD